MQYLGTNERYGMLCGCLLTLPKSDSAMESSPRFVDLVEWRLDSLLRGVPRQEWKAVLSRLRVAINKPAIATCRSLQQGGLFTGPEQQRSDILMMAFHSGAQWVDLEQDIDKALIEPLRAQGAKVVLSWHDFSGTPSANELQDRLKAMADTGADIVKIVTYARQEADGLRVLELISRARKEPRVPVIAFCMGEKGRWTRPMSIVLGSPWTYVKLVQTEEAAPGQLNATETRKIIEILKP